MGYNQPQSTPDPSGRTAIVSKPDQLASFQEAADEVERELQVRYRCYDRWVNDGKLTETEARRRYVAMYSALRYLRHFMDIDTGKLAVFHQQDPSQSPEQA